MMADGLTSDVFPATLGTRERLSTLGAVLVGTVGMTILGVVFTAKSGELFWLLMSLPFTVMLFLAGGRAPTGYRLAPDGVHVERRAGPAVIPYRQIRAVDREARPVNGMTVGGSRGVFGRFGRFWNGRLGFYRLFLSNRESVVWLETEGGWVGLSPDRPAEFVERLRSRLPPARPGWPEGRA